MLTVCDGMSRRVTARHSMGAGRLACFCGWRHGAARQGKWQQQGHKLFRGLKCSGLRRHAASGVGEGLGCLVLHCRCAVFAGVAKGGDGAVRFKQHVCDCYVFLVARMLLRKGWLLL